MIALLSPFFIVTTLTGFLFLITGWFMYHNPPKKINGWYGYRTPASFKSQERWDFAQKYAARLSSKVGLVLMVLGFLGGFFAMPLALDITLQLVLLIGACIYLIAATERAIKRQFPEDS